MASGQLSEAARHGHSLGTRGKAPQGKPATTVAAMAEIEMPEGLYFSLSGVVRPGTGGQTRALLMRNRLLTQKAGVETTLLTFDSPPVYPDVRAGLEEQGQLVPGMRLLNIFEWYRAHEGADDEPIADSLPKLDGFVTEDEQHPDGTVYLTKYLQSRAGVLHPAIHDYRRPDGSVYLRAPAGVAADSTPASPYVLVNRQGAPTHTWPRKGGWHRLWLRTLAGDAERVFVISDSRFALAHIAPMRDQRFHLLHLMHNTHTVGERRWDSQLSADYGPLLRGIHKIDGLVTLTARQREDVIERYGETNNLFVVPNPVDLPKLPETRPRATGRGSPWCPASNDRSVSRTRSPRSPWSSSRSRRPASTSTAWGTSGSPCSR